MEAQWPNQSKLQRVSDFQDHLTPPLEGSKSTEPKHLPSTTSIITITGPAQNIGGFAQVVRIKAYFDQRARTEPSPHDFTVILLSKLKPLWIVWAFSLSRRLHRTTASTRVCSPCRCRYFSSLISRLRFSPSTASLPLLAFFSLVPYQSFLLKSSREEESESHGCW